MDIKKIHSCKICGSKDLPSSGKCVWCKYENDPKNYLKNYKKDFYKLKKAFEEYREGTDMHLGSVQSAFFKEEKKVRFWKNVCAVLLVLLAEMLIFTLFK